MIPFEKKQLPLLFLLPCLSNYGAALGVGEHSVQSALGAPLLAEIPLTEFGGEQLIVGLAESAVHQRLGVASPERHSHLLFETILDEGPPRIRVSTRAPVSEPYVSFALSVKWPDGSLVRRYTLLLDPVGRASAASGTVIQRATGDRRFDSSIRTHRGDSLWRLARRLPRPENTNIAQAMNAVYRLNPHAFVGGDPARLKPDVPIQAPDAGQIESSPRRFQPVQTEPAHAVADSGTEAKAGTGSSADGNRAATAAIPANSKPPSPADGDLQDMLQGLKAGIAAAEAGKVRSKAHIAVLEQELSALVERYEALSKQTQALEQRVASRSDQPGSEQSVTALPAPARKALQFAGTMAGFAFAGYLVGLALAQGRRPKRPAGAKQSVLARIMGQKTKGSATYEQPYERPASATNESQAITPIPQPSGPEEEQSGVEDPGLVAAGYTAFGMYDEAESLLNEAILEQPERLDLKLQLLEFYSKISSDEQFETLAQSIEGDTDDPSVATRIELLRLQCSANDDEETARDTGT